MSTSLMGEIADMIKYAGVEAAEDVIAALRRQLEEAKRTIGDLQDCLHKKNLALDALHYVWCSGGCESGTHRYSDQELTSEIVGEAVRNTDRLVQQFINRAGRVHGEEEGYEKVWASTRERIGASALTALQAENERLREAAGGYLIALATWFLAHTKSDKEQMRASLKTIDEASERLRSALAASDQQPDEGEKDG